MKFRAKHLFIPLLLLSAVIQCVFGNFPYAFFAFPLDALLALFWIVGMAYAYKEKRSPPSRDPARPSSAHPHPAPGRLLRP